MNWDYYRYQEMAEKAGYIPTISIPEYAEFEPGPDSQEELAANDSGMWSISSRLINFINQNDYTEEKPVEPEPEPENKFDWVDRRLAETWIMIETTISDESWKRLGDWEFPFSARLADFTDKNFDKIMGEI